MTPQKGLSIVPVSVTFRLPI